MFPEWEDAGPIDSARRVFLWAHNTPLCTTLPDFAACSDAMQLHPATALILDDMRVITRLVLDQTRDPTPLKAQKLRSTTQWLQNRIADLPPYAPDPDPQRPKLELVPKSNSPPPIIPIPTTALVGGIEPDYVYQCVRQTALMFCRTVIARRPFRLVIEPADLIALWGSMWRVPLEQWATILGVFVWIQTITAPAARVMPPCVAVKSMFPVSMLQLAQENWGIAKEVFANGLKIQDWLRTGSVDENIKQEEEEE